MVRFSKLQSNILLTAVRTGTPETLRLCLENGRGKDTSAQIIAAWNSARNKGWVEGERLIEQAHLSISQKMASSPVLAVSGSAQSFIDPRVGQYIVGEGVYMGLWVPRDESGKPVGIECEMFASTADLRHIPGVANSLKTYNESKIAVAGIRKWGGHNGAWFENEIAIVDFLTKNVHEYISNGGIVDDKGWFYPSGIGKWFLAPRELMDGKGGDNERGKIVTMRSMSMYDLRNVGYFEDSFVTVRSESSDAAWYWSSTPLRKGSAQVCFIIFSDGGNGCGRGDDLRLSARPVRVGRVRLLTPTA